MFLQDIGFSIECTDISGKKTVSYWHHLTLISWFLFNWFFSLSMLSSLDVTSSYFGCCFNLLSLLVLLNSSWSCLTDVLKLIKWVLLFSICGTVIWKWNLNLICRVISAHAHQETTSSSGIIHTQHSSKRFANMITCFQVPLNILARISFFIHLSDFWIMLPILSFRWCYCLFSVLCS